MTGWTMNEVRQHSLGDVLAMLELLGDEVRVKQMRRSAGL